MIMKPHASGAFLFMMIHAMTFHLVVKQVLNPAIFIC